VLPVGENTQQLMRITRHRERFSSENIETVKFVPLVNGELA